MQYGASVKYSNGLYENLCFWKTFVDATRRRPNNIAGSVNRKCQYGVSSDRVNEFVVLYLRL